MGLNDDIRSEISKKNKFAKPGTEIVTSSESLLIEQTLNKLFYMKPKIEEEAEFVKLVLSKNGYDCERAGLHASAIIAGEKDFCYREQVLSLLYKMNGGKDIPIGLKRIFEEGNSIHEKWQRLFIRGGLGEAEDMDRSRFKKKYELSYTPDAILTIGGHEYVGEIKSVNTFQFKNMHSHPSGKKQLMFYMWLTGIERGFVLCEDKNTQDIKVFTYHFSLELVEEFIARLEAIQVYKRRVVEEGKMVKGICKSSTCQRAEKCNMRDACWNIGQGRIKL